MKQIEKHNGDLTRISVIEYTADHGQATLKIHLRQAVEVEVHADRVLVGHGMFTVLYIRSIYVLILKCIIEISLQNQHKDYMCVRYD